jgi:hypothetical protein
MPPLALTEMTLDRFSGEEMSTLKKRNMAKQSGNTQRPFALIEQTLMLSKSGVMHTKESAIKIKH